MTVLTDVGDSKTIQSIELQPTCRVNRAWVDSSTSDHMRWNLIMDTGLRIPACRRYHPPPSYDSYIRDDKYPSSALIVIMTCHLAAMARQPCQSDQRFLAPSTPQRKSPSNTQAAPSPTKGAANLALFTPGAGRVRRAGCVAVAGPLGSAARLTLGALLCAAPWSGGRDGPSSLPGQKRPDPCAVRWPGPTMSNSRQEWPISFVASGAVVSFSPAALNDLIRSRFVSPIAVNSLD